MEDCRRIVLASASPRRRELLGQMGVAHRVLVTECREDLPGGTRAEDAPLVLSERKARAAAAMMAGAEERLVLAADTLILLDGRAVGKARDEGEAASILRSLSGRSHAVVTGVALMDARSGRISLRSESTEVEFREMSGDEVVRLVATGEWRGAAGAYKIQGRSGCFVRRIAGSYPNVVGLPISAVYDMLSEQGFPPFG